MKARNILKWMGRGLLVPTAAYVSLYATDLAFTLLSPKIKSQQELERVVEEEAEKRGMDAEKISVVFSNDPYDAGCDSGEDGESTIYLGSTFASRRMVKHELTHLYFDDPSYDRGLVYELKYFLFYEPRAILNSF